MTYAFICLALVSMVAAVHGVWYLLYTLFGEK